MRIGLHGAAILVIALVILAGCGGGQGNAPSLRYTITDLGPGMAVSVNNRGQVALQLRGTPSVPTVHAVVWEAGQVTNLSIRDFPFPTRINNAGQVVGYLSPPEGAIGTLWKDGQIIDLGSLGETNTAAFDINSQGQIVGRTSGGAGLNGAFLYENGEMKALADRLPANSGWMLASANAINDAGLIAGTGRLNTTKLRYFLFDTRTNTIRDIGASIDSASFTQRLTEDGRTYFTTTRDNHFVTFTYDGSGLTELPLLPGYEGGYGWDMNEAGQIVGFFGSSQTGRAALWTNGNAIDLNSVLVGGEGWVLREAMGINDQSQIVGYGEYNGEVRAFLLTPAALP